jgi:hypothetical protein
VAICPNNDSTTIRDERRSATLRSGKSLLYNVKRVMMEGGTVRWGSRYNFDDKNCAKVINLVAAGDQKRT